MKVRRGDVVTIDHPFSDDTGSKVRPALVVQNDKRNALLTETVVVMITKNILYVATDPMQRRRLIAHRLASAYRSAGLAAIISKKAR